ncbi:MAG: LapA family protein [Peptococcaceae bacterium]|nr:LapA family protein [Peptococcaceae bacterium]
MFILVLALICALLIAVFSLQNAAPVPIHLGWLTAQIPLVIVILVAVLAGALIVLLLAIWREFQMKKKRKALTAAAETCGCHPVAEQTADQTPDQEKPPSPTEL